jgi:hypothetical protein
MVRVRDKGPRTCAFSGKLNSNCCAHPTRAEGYMHLATIYYLWSRLGQPILHAVLIFEVVFSPFFLGETTNL